MSEEAGLIFWARDLCAYGRGALSDEFDMRSMCPWCWRLYKGGVYISEIGTFAAGLSLGPVAMPHSTRYCVILYIQSGTWCFLSGVAFISGWRYSGVWIYAERYGTRLWALTATDDQVY